jgi:hypothetical protein
MSTSIWKSGSFSQPHDSNAAIIDVDMPTSQNAEDPHLVVLEPEDNPQNKSLFRRWLMILVIITGSYIVSQVSVALVEN